MANDSIHLVWRGANYYFDDDVQNIEINGVVFIFGPRNEPGYIRNNWTAAIGLASPFACEATGSSPQAALDALEARALAVLTQVTEALGEP